MFTCILERLLVTFIILVTFTKRYIIRLLNFELVSVDERWFYVYLLTALKKGHR